MKEAAVLEAEKRYVHLRDEHLAAMHDSVERVEAIAAEELDALAVEETSVLAHTVASAEAEAAARLEREREHAQQRFKSARAQMEARFMRASNTDMEETITEMRATMTALGAQQREDLHAQRAALRTKLDETLSGARRKHERTFAAEEAAAERDGRAALERLAAEAVAHRNAVLQVGGWVGIRIGRRGGGTSREIACVRVDGWMVAWMNGWVL